MYIPCDAVWANEREFRSISHGIPCPEDDLPRQAQALPQSLHILPSPVNACKHSGKEEREMTRYDGCDDKDMKDLMEQSMQRNRCGIP